MDRETAKTVKADNPLSITDGAPHTVEVCGMPCRLPAAMDYRIAARIEEACEIDEVDQAVCLLYCCLHADKKQIGKLWAAARDPKKLWNAIGVWQAGVPVDALSNAINELMGMVDDGEDGAEGDEDEPETGKKKTGAR